MPRNGSSVYSLPAGNPVVPGTVIATTWANTTLTDIATALTNSLSTDGSTASVSLAGKTLAGGTFNAPSVTGILGLTGGQIAFPAVQVPSANVNTLDDYEEGTFTATFTFATPGDLAVGYAVRVGTYTKIGNAVAINVNIQTSSFTWTTSSGLASITGLPFNTAQSVGFSMFVQSNFSGSNLIVGGLIASGGSAIQLDAVITSTGAFLALNTGSFPSAANKIFVANFTYPAA